VSGNTTQIKSDYLIRQVIRSIFLDCTLREIVFSDASIAFFTRLRE
jgi:hypothetical protein